MVANKKNTIILPFFFFFGQTKNSYLLHLFREKKKAHTPLMKKADYTHNQISTRQPFQKALKPSQI